MAKTKARKGGSQARAARQGRARADRAPSLKEFERATWGSLTSMQLSGLAVTASGVKPETRPERVPLQILDLMGWDPIIYIGETAVMAPLQDPEIYSIKHKDPAIVAEVEAWLWPILNELVAGICRSFAYGAVPVVLDWAMDDLHTLVKGNGGEQEIVIPEHLHYSKVHEIWPGDVTVNLALNDDLISVIHGSREYFADAGGAFLPVWDRQFGRLLGQGSRRRAFKPWLEGVMIELWESRWYERSVDSPRIGFAPNAKIKIDGVDFEASDILASGLMSLKNGEAAAFPSAVDENGNRLWDVKTLDLADRSQAWERGLGRRDMLKLTASLAASTLLGIDDSNFASSKVTSHLFITFVQRIANFVGANLTRIVQVVHRQAHGNKYALPEIVVPRLPQAQQKLYLEVLKICINAKRALEDGREYRLGDLAPDSIWKMLGFDARSPEEAAVAPEDLDSFGPTPGPAQDTTSDRGTRRDDARTDSGESSTGAPGQGEDAAAKKTRPRRGS